MATTVFDVLLQKMDEHCSSAIDFLADGRAKNETEYRETCGLIRGYRTAMREISDLSRNYMKDEDNE